MSIYPARLLDKASRFELRQGTLNLETNEKLVEGLDLEVRLPRYPKGKRP